MANTYTLISSVTVGAGGAASIDFTSIPATYTDLLFVLSVRSTYPSGNPSLYYAPNGSTTNLTTRRLIGSGSAASSNTALGEDWIDGGGQTASTFASTQIYVPNYTNSSTYKSFSMDNVQENNATAARATLTAGLNSSNSAITSFTFTTDSNFAQYSTAYLYGIKNS